MNHITRALLCSLPFFFQACLTDGEGGGTAQSSTTGAGSSSSLSHGSSSSSVSELEYISNIALTVSGDTVSITGVLRILDSTAYVELLVNGVETFPFCDSYGDESALTFDFGANGCWIDPYDLQDGQNTLEINIYSGEVVLAREYLTFHVVLSDEIPGLTDVPMLSESSITLGAQGADVGSSVDLDSWTVYPAAAITASNAPSIDLVLHNDGNVLSLMTPTEAIAIDYLTTKLVEGNETILFPLDLNQAEFDAIDMLADLPDFYNVDPVVTSEVFAGASFVVITDRYMTAENAGIFLIFVETAGAGNAATITIKGLHP